MKRASHRAGWEAGRRADRRVFDAWHAMNYALLYHELSVQETAWATPE